MKFDDETIRQLFGTDTAEDEDSDRLREYFFRNKSYDNIRSNLPLRVLVGHKGIGKSALLRMSHMEDQDDDILSLWVQPSDLILKDSSVMNFNEKILQYKIVLSRQIYHKALNALHIGEKNSPTISIQNTAVQILSAIAERIASIGGVDIPERVGKLREKFEKTREVRVYIDDIDRGWKATKDDINNLSALMNAARDLTNEDKNVKIRIGLRSDAYYLYRTSDESTDKVESNVIRLMWDRHDVITVMALRVASYLGSETDLRTLEQKPQKEIAKELHPIIESKFSVGRGHWDGALIHTVLLSLNRNRPRDLIKLLTEAGKEAYRNDHSIIKSKDLESIFANYSHGRINDLVLEFKTEMPEIDRLLYNMGPSTKLREKELRWVYSNDRLITKLKNIRSNHTLTFANGQPATEKAIAEFLYKIDFIIARSEGPDGNPIWTHFDQNRMLQSQFVDFGYHWEVHPAYRWALQPKSVHEILDSIDTNYPSSTPR